MSTNINTNIILKKEDIVNRVKNKSAPPLQGRLGRGLRKIELGDY